jgi:hypothetical protein
MTKISDAERTAAAARGRQAALDKFGPVAAVGGGPVDPGPQLPTGPAPEPYTVDGTVRPTFPAQQSPPGGAQPSASRTPPAARGVATIAASLATGRFAVPQIVWTELGEIGRFLRPDGIADVESIKLALAALEERRPDLLVGYRAPEPPATPVQQVAAAAAERGRQAALKRFGPVAPVGGGPVGGVA